ncbi:MAG: glutamate synthase subunit beta [Streptosporangiaceae bacterium]
MADPTGFLRTQRQTGARRPVDVRITDWREVYAGMRHADLERQAGRCMGCGIPFCHNGCPLGNLIPEWNDLVRRQHWRDAVARLHATNNFPEFTGLLCPAPCESACVLGINADPVAIKQVELELIDRAWAEGWVTTQPPGPVAMAAGKRVAVVGSGPAGLAAAQQLARAGHAVSVIERDDLPGGLLRYGIPEFKMEKWRLDRRIDQIQAEGAAFKCGVEAGTDISAADLRRDYQAIVLACGARVPRGLQVPGAGLGGIHQAMEYLPLANRAVADVAQAAADSGVCLPGEPVISARGRHVVIIGGGDTGADCLGTVLRQGAAAVTQLEIMPRPPQYRPPGQPWPTHPMIFRISTAHEEGGERVYAVSTLEFLGDERGRVRALRVADVDMADGRLTVRQDTEREISCDLVLLAMGFTGAEQGELLAGLGIGLTERGTVGRDNGYATPVPGVFVAGDMGRGQSLIVWAIAEGRSAAAAADRFLSGTTTLPAAIPASAAPLRLAGP